MKPKRSSHRASKTCLLNQSLDSKKYLLEEGADEPQPRRKRGTQKQHQSSLLTNRSSFSKRKSLQVFEKECLKRKIELEKREEAHEKLLTLQHRLKRALKKESKKQRERGTKRTAAGSKLEVGVVGFPPTTQGTIYYEINDGRKQYYSQVNRADAPWNDKIEIVLQTGLEVLKIIIFDNEDHSPID
jgi:hypothetical protein